MDFSFTLGDIVGSGATIIAVVKVYTTIVARLAVLELKVEDLWERRHAPRR